MIAPNEFQVSCMSNGSMDKFPNNTLAAFTNYFDNGYSNLDVEYEMGIEEIHFPKALNNVRKGKNTFIISYQTKKTGKWVEVEKEVPPGFYKTIPKLIEKLLSNYGETSRKNMTLIGLDISFNETTRKVRVSANDLRLKIVRINGKVFTPDSHSAHIILKGDIARLLGFPDNAVITKGDEKFSPIPVTVSGGFHQIFIYSDMITGQDYPDGKANILRVIPFEGVSSNSNETVERTFFPIYFMNIAKSRASEMRFEIRDDTGELVQFQFGKVYISLRFRKKSK